MITESGPIRILHVVGGMKRGGAETWLMNLLRRMNRAEFQMDFLVHTDEPGAYDEEIRDLGSQVIPCLHPQQPLAYARNFRRAMEEHGPYDIIHSAVHHFSGYVLRLAARTGVRGRIAHSHNASPGDGNALTRPIYLRLMKHWIQEYATAGLACSSPAATALFGENWNSDERWRLHFPSTDLTPFAEKVNRWQVRNELNIPSDALVVGHVGRFDPQKNHKFLVQIASELIRRRQDVRFLLIGAGPLQASIENQVKDLGLEEYFVFAGLRGDVPRLMRGAMDCFLLPSLHEGLPLVAVEAQASGLPLIMSDAITSEAVIIPRIVAQISLAQSAAVWADVILRTCHIPHMKPEQALESVAHSPFNIERAKGELEALYCRLAGRGRNSMELGEALTA